jgi:hypothetical protein
MKKLTAERLAIGVLAAAVTAWLATRGGAE